MKKQITATKPIYEGVVEGRLIDIQENIKQLIEEHGEEASIVLDAGSNNISADISFKREETDEEYQARLKKEESEKKNKKKEEELERKEFERLKKKYG